MPPHNPALDATITGLEPVGYTLEELHQATGFPKDTLYDWIRSGELIAAKYGVAYRVHPDDWAAFVTARRQRAAAS